MAWIESFTVAGLAGRDETISHTLDRNLNIFWGLNGAGKTTLFKLFHAAMENDASGLEDLPFSSVEIIFRVGPDEKLITRSYSKPHGRNNMQGDSDDLFADFDFSVEDAVIEVEDENPLWETISEDASGKYSSYDRSKFRHSYMPITRVTDNRRRPFSYSDERRPSNDDIFESQVREKWRDYTAKSLSRIREIQQQGLATILAIMFGGTPTQQSPVQQIDEVEPSEAYDLVRTFLSEQRLSLQMERDAFISRFRGSPEHQQVVEEIQAVRSRTEVVLRPQREFQAIIGAMYTGNKRLLSAAPRSPRLTGSGPLKIEINDRTVPLTSLSSGEKQLLQLLLEVLGAGESAVMIDEPELSMHVNWQQQLVASMKTINGDCQLLLASHSPEIMADVPDEYVFEL